MPPLLGRTHENHAWRLRESTHCPQASSTKEDLGNRRFSAGPQRRNTRSTNHESRKEPPFTPPPRPLAPRQSGRAAATPAATARRRFCRTMIVARKLRESCPALLCRLYCLRCLQHVSMMLMMMLMLVSEMKTVNRAAHHCPCAAFCLPSRTLLPVIVLCSASSLSQ